MYLNSGKCYTYLHISIMKFWTNGRLHACVILSYFYIRAVECQCVLPFSNGTWLTSSRGTWTIPENSTEIRDFKGSLTPSQTTYDLVCVSSSGNQYILGTSSSIELFPDIIVNSYTCIEIQTTSHSPLKYEFYFVTDIDLATNEPFTSNISIVCDGTASKTGPNSNIVIADGIDARTVKITLPNVIRGDYRVTITDQNGATSNETLFGSCDDTSAFYITEVVNATHTISPVGFSDSGVLYHVSSYTSSGITYIYTFNNDTSVDAVTTYRFACWVVVQGSGSSVVYATVYPEVCQEGQNGTHVPSGGQVLVLEPSVTCPDISSEGSGLNVVIIVVIVLVCVVMVTVVVVVIIYIVRKKKRKDLSKPLPKNTKDDSNGTNGRKDAKRPKSSNDLDSARLIDEKNKQKLAKKMAKKKETRTIAVQASIWTAPIKRTTTALKTSVRRSSSQGSIKFIPYVDKPVLVTNNVTGKSVIRSNTNLENRHQETKQHAMTRSKTTVERKTPKTVPKYLVKKNKVSGQKQKLLRQISEINAHSVDRYADEFEKLNPFPHEGNPNDYHNTLDVPDETEAKEMDSENDSKAVPENDTKVEENKVAAKTKQNISQRENTKMSLRSRPSTTDGILGVNLNRSGSVRKTNSEQMNRTMTIMKFSYHSPYAMSEAQKEYLTKKADWIRNQVQKDRESKKHIEEMRKLESQRAFDAWMKNKRKSIHSFKRKVSKVSSQTSSTSGRSLVKSTESS